MYGCSRIYCIHISFKHIIYVKYKLQVVSVLCIVKWVIFFIVFSKQNARSSRKW